MLQIEEVRNYALPPTVCTVELCGDNHWEILLNKSDTNLEADMVKILDLKDYENGTTHVYEIRLQAMVRRIQ